MGKFSTYRVYVIILSVAVCIAAALLIRYYLLGTKEVKASVSPSEVELGIPVHYTDSTNGARHWLWEFGDGNSSTDRNGFHTFEKAGKYQVRLTVNGSHERRFFVNVRPVNTNDDVELIKINAPETGIQGEYLVFRGEGLSNEWRWEFGESGTVDSREKSTIYKYEYPGIYEVLLSTEETKYPIRHLIEIFPQYAEDDSTDVETLIGNDIKEKLQNIVDQKPFNTNYNYILNSYLCDNSNTLVIINNSKKNDFYSYCQGLKIIGRKKTTIESVVIELDPVNDACVRKLNVIQSDY